MPLSDHLHRHGAVATAIMVVIFAALVWFWSPF